MKIITSKGTFDTEKEGVVLIFNDDNELSSFISLLVKIPIRLTGVRILPLIPENVELTPLQTTVIGILEDLDGIGGNDNKKISDNVINSIKDILNS